MGPCHALPCPAHLDGATRREGARRANETARLAASGDLKSRRASSKHFDEESDPRLPCTTSSSRLPSLTPYLGQTVAKINQTLISTVAASNDVKTARDCVGRRAPGPDAR